MRDSDWDAGPSVQTIFVFRKSLKAIIVAFPPFTPSPKAPQSASRWSAWGRRPSKPSSINLARGGWQTRVDAVFF
jgi:hypothetical protein